MLRTTRTTRHPRTPLRRTGFTLIEVLVVIAIIALLITILVPSLTKAKASARNTQCLSRLKAIGVAYTLYVNDHGRFPPMNNEDDDGAWQYNYLIYDGRDSNKNFGPLLGTGRYMDDVLQLYCPVQEDNYHSQATYVNPWPIVSGMDTRSSYSRRYHLTGKSFSQFRNQIAYVSDVLHLPKVIKSAHKTGVNAVYTDGHVRWVRDPGLLTDNELTHPFDPMDNPIMEDIWDVLDEAP